MSEATHRCGSTATASGEPCQAPVSDPGDTCWRESHVAGSLDHLTPKQRRFVEEYTGRHMGNATQAAIAAGYSENAAAEIGYENLNKPQIADAVEDRLEEQAMPADEVLARLADMARASMDRFVEVRDDGTWRLDLEQGALYPVKELSYDANGLPKIKTYDAQGALKQLAKVHGLQVDKVEHSGPEGGPIQTESSVDLSELSTEELKLLKQLRKRAHVAGNGARG